MSTQTYAPTVGTDYLQAADAWLRDPRNRDGWLEDPEAMLAHEEQMELLTSQFGGEEMAVEYARRVWRTAMRNFRKNPDRIWHAAEAVAVERMVADRAARRPALPAPAPVY